MLAVEDGRIFDQRSIIPRAFLDVLKDRSWTHLLILLRSGENCFQKVCGVALVSMGGLVLHSVLLMPIDGIVNWFCALTVNFASVESFIIK